jgi:hypothetical protein
MTYLGTQTAAARLIAAKGQEVTLTRHSAGAYDTATGEVIVTDTVTVTTGVVLPLSRGLMQMPGTNIQAGDRQLLLSGAIDPPEINDTMSIGGAPYTIVEVSPLNPGGTVLVYDCVIRGAP